MRIRLAPSWAASLTWKAAVFITVMSCMLAALLGGLVHASVTHQTVTQAREKALDRLSETVEAYQDGEPLPWRSGIDPPDLPPTLHDLALKGQRGTMVADRGGRTVMWAAGPADGKVIATAVDYSQSAKTITNLDQSILASSVLAIGATLLIGAFTVTRITRRLRKAALVAGRISTGDLDARVNDPRARGPRRRQDEVAILSGALDTMASSLQRKLESEQRFTADVAHELRTPLTGLHAAAELLPPGRPSELVQDRVRVLRSLTEDLLEISRLDAGSETVDLAFHLLPPIAERVALAAGAGTEVRVGRAARVESDKRRLERVIGNLVGNAHKHGRAPVVVSVEGPVVTVRDHGAGYPEYLLEHGPQRFRTNAETKGHGLGLTIAVGQAAVIGAELVFRNAEEAEGGGAEARLTLPEYVSFDDTAAGAGSDA